MMQRRDTDGPADHHWGKFGFLVADLFTALAILFLVANTVGHVPPAPTPTPTSEPPTPTVVQPTPTPIICGLDPHAADPVILTVSDPDGLRAENPDAERTFAAQVHDALAKYASKTAGLAEVYGGSYNGPQDVGDGVNLARGAISSLLQLANQQFIFTGQRTLYQPFWDGTLASNQVKMLVFFYNVSSTASCAA